MSETELSTEQAIQYEAMLPIQVELKLVQAGNELARCGRSIREARIKEVDARMAYQRARRRAGFREDCPKPKRGADGEPTVTVAQREDWIEEQVDAECLAWNLAKAELDAAKDHKDVTRDISSLVQSIAALVRDSMKLGGPQHG